MHILFSFLSLFTASISHAGVDQVVVGANHACAIFNHGKMKCWGRNDFGQLGLVDDYSRGDKEDMMGSHLPWVNLGSSTGQILKVSLGFRSTCALFETGKIKCWGENDQGQLGCESDANLAIMNVPNPDALPYVKLGTNIKVKDLAMSASTVCILTLEGKVKCWGSNDDGHLGIGMTGSRGQTPGDMGDALPFVDVGTAEPVIQLAVGASHTCVLFESGRVKCWGNNGYAQLGLGDSLNRGDSKETMGKNGCF